MASASRHGDVLDALQELERALDRVARRSQSMSARLAQLGHDPGTDRPLAEIVSEESACASLGWRGDRLRASVADDDPTWPDVRHPDHGGRGLRIVHALAQGWEVAPDAGGGKVVWSEVPGLWPS